MFYIVECSYSDANSEREWNTFYDNQKLPALLSVTGFRTSQRFRALTPGYPHYFALHTIISADVLASDEYRIKGGGNFSRWQEYITDWHRNLYESENTAPAVAPEAFLLLSEQPLTLLETELGYRPWVMLAAGLGYKPRQRVAYIIASEHVELCRTLPDTCLYQPLTVQLRNNTFDQ